MQNVVETGVAVGSLQGQHVQRVLHHADLLLLSLWVSADGAGAGVGQVLTFLTEYYLLLYRADGVGQVVGLLLGQTNNVVGQPLGAFGPNPGQAVQLLDKASQ